MIKPKLPKNPTLEQVINWEVQMIDYEETRINHMQSLRGSFMRACVDMGHTIDRMGHRTLFSATNSLGVTKMFDTSKEALAEARASLNQPVKIAVCPIRPANRYWAVPIDVLVKMIMEYGQNG